MNKVFLIGNVGKPPEVKSFEWGKVAKFSLATSESYKNKDGEKVTETEWHNLVFKGKICDVVENYVHKGDKLHVQGKIKTRQYTDKDGNNHWATEIICDELELIESKKQEPKETEWKGKQPVKSMSDINDLPGAESDPSYVPDNINPEMPF